MKRLILIIVFFIYNNNFFAQNWTQSNFSSVITPQYCFNSSTNKRGPLIFRATISGLSNSTTYRYIIQGILNSDIGGTNSAGGSFHNDGSTWSYFTSPSISSSYGTFTTDASGNFTGWFGQGTTSNTRFDIGNSIIPGVVIGNNSGTILYRYALDVNVVCLNLATSGSNTSTAIYGNSYATTNNIILLYDNTAGSGSPLSMSLIENTNATSSITSLASFYTNNSVTTTNGAWGTLIPNSNVNGVRRIEERSLSDGSVLHSATDADGSWPSGANTVNPSGGTTAIQITNTDAPLPVELTSFTSNVVGNKVELNWQTATEVNNYGFEVERSQTSNVKSETWEKIGFVQGNGNSNSPKNYSFTDQPTGGKEFKYRLKQIDFDGSFEYSYEITAKLGNVTNYKLDQNYPNPFNPFTKISYTIPQREYVHLRVYDMLAKVVAELVNTTQESGRYEVTLDGTNLPSGAYFYKLEAGNYIEVKKLLLVK